MMYGITFDIKHQELNKDERELLLSSIDMILTFHGLMRDNEYTYMLFGKQNPMSEIYKAIKELSDDEFIASKIKRLVVLNISDYSDLTDCIKN
jgi:virulence-associated protein VapD